MITWAREVGEGLRVFLERIPGGYQEEVTLIAAGWRGGHLSDFQVGGLVNKG